MPWKIYHSTRSSLLSRPSAAQVDTSLKLAGNSSHTDSNKVVHAHNSQFGILLKFNCCHIWCCVMSPLGLSSGDRSDSVVPALLSFWAFWTGFRINKSSPLYQLKPWSLHLGPISRVPRWPGYTNVAVQTGPDWNHCSLLSTLPGL